MTERLVVPDSCATTATRPSLVMPAVICTKVPGAMIDQSAGHGPFGDVCAFWISRPAAVSMATTISRDSSKNGTPFCAPALGASALGVAGFLALLLAVTGFNVAFLAIVSVLRTGFSISLLAGKYLPARCRN